MVLVGFVAVFAVWRLGARAWWFGLTHAREGVGCRLWESDVRVMGGDRVGTRFWAGHTPRFGLPWISLSYKSRPRGRQPIAGTWPVWGKSWRCGDLQEPGRTRS